MKHVILFYFNEKNTVLYIEVYFLLPGVITFRKQTCSQYIGCTVYVMHYLMRLRHFDWRFENPSQDMNVCDFLVCV